LQSLPSQARPSSQELRVNAHGFSLHAAVRWRADQRKELEHLCRYITRPAIANERLKRNRANHISWSRFTLPQLCQNYMYISVRIGKIDRLRPLLNA
jgi:Putative transposase